MIAERVRARRPQWDERGLTLVEVLVALLVLGIVLAALASTLINLTRATAVNEHRVQATAYLTSLHENLQALPWTRVALYAEEVALLDGRIDGLDLEATVPTFEGEPIVTIPGPVNTGCPVDDPDCGRLRFVPVAFQDEVVIDDRSFELVQIVTETDERVAEGEEPIRRFVTEVRWTLLGREYAERFESLRAPTPEERARAAETDVLLFMISPRRIVLDDEGRNEDEIRVFARFRPGETNAWLRLPPEVDCPGADLDGRLVLTADAELGFGPADSPGFATAIEAQDCEFGGTETTLTARLEGQVFTSDEADGFYSFPLLIDRGPGVDADPDEPPAARFRPVVDTNVELLPPPPARILVGAVDGFDGDRICADVELRTRVSTTVDPAGTPVEALTATVYLTGTGSQARAMTEAAAIDATTADLRLVLRENEPSPWRLEPGGTYLERFHVIPSAGPDGQDGPHAASNVVTVEAVVLCPT